MKILNKLIILSSIGATILSANTSEIYTKIENMKKGTDGYIIGKALTQEQQDKARANMIKSSYPKIVNFLDGKDLLVSINKENKRVLIINKRYSKVDQKTVKGMIGNMIHDFDEPTAMAHDKMVYWVFDDNGKKLSEEDLKNWKDSLNDKVKPGMALAEAVNLKKEKEVKVEFNPYVSVKLQSDQPMMTEVENPKLASPYLLIKSDKLIGLTNGAK